MSKVAYLLILYFAVSFITGIESVWEIDSRIYFVGQQISILILLAVLYFKTNKPENIIISSLIILTILETLDEMWKLNDRFRVNDYIITGMILLWTIYRYAKWSMKRQNL